MKTKAKLTGQLMCHLLLKDAELVPLPRASSLQASATEFDIRKM